MTDIGDMIERGSDGPEWEQYRRLGTLAELTALRAEVERLREECAFWRDRLRIMSLKADGQHRWRLSGTEWPCLIGPDADAVVRNALEAVRMLSHAPARPDAG